MPQRQQEPELSQGPAPRPFFTRVSQAVSKAAGKPVTFIGAVAVIAIWGATGPLFGFNDTWQLIINTSTTIITFLMVFLIQNSQNRDTAALQIKLDELIARTEGPRKALLDLEDLDEETLDRLRAEYARLADRARGEADEGAEVEPVNRTIKEICNPESCPPETGDDTVEVKVVSAATGSNAAVAEARASKAAAGKVEQVLKATRRKAAGGAGGVLEADGPGSADTRPKPRRAAR
ncbi:low affinity iron permease family protein [Azorhizobium doebereinerae]|uniref:low affinity iron permease family protein n=1 Tax=Azorhizobium doebereinerae TaxID=281091 RepID=UPI0003F64FF0